MFVNSLHFIFREKCFWRLEIPEIVYLEVKFFSYVVSIKMFKFNIWIIVWSVFLKPHKSQPYSTQDLRKNFPLFFPGKSRKRRAMNERSLASTTLRTFEYLR